MLSPSPAAVLHAFKTIKSALKFNSLISLAVKTHRIRYHLVLVSAPTLVRLSFPTHCHGPCVAKEITLNFEVSISFKFLSVASEPRKIHTQIQEIFSGPFSKPVAGAESDFAIKIFLNHLD